MVNFVILLSMAMRFFSVSLMMMIVMMMMAVKMIGLLQVSLVFSSLIANFQTVNVIFNVQHPK